MAATVTFLRVEELKAPWREFAACKGMGTTVEDAELFHPERAELTEPAKQVCWGCPVAWPCLEYALETVQKVGVWGGRSERERRQMRRAIRASEAEGKPWPEWVRPLQPGVDPYPKIPRRRPWRLPNEDRARKEVRARRLALLEVA